MFTTSYKGITKNGSPSYPDFSMTWAILDTVLFEEEINDK